MKEYKFYGWEHADVAPINDDYKKIADPRQMYDLLSEVWSAETCAPRLRGGWSKDNMTLGQCSITSFLVQDIFGGRVYGVPLPEGGFHCYNIVGDCAFDLTSEQFGDEKLVYNTEHEQFRDVHFADEDKKNRYELFKAGLEKLL